jgi:hypothetical protein
VGELRARDQERRLRNAIHRVEAVSGDESALIVRLRRLAATLPSVRRGVTNDPQESKKHARALAREMGLDKETTRNLVLAAELHEIGKATIDRAALYEPTELDAENRALVDSHAANAAELAAGVGRPEVVSALALQNERHDGTGPQGIGGDDLPFIAQALSVVAAYVAMTSKRPFRPALDRAHAIEVLRAEAGWQFDPYVVDAFVETLPQQRAATIAASAGASFARPVRSARLAYRRHGRASTVVVSSFSAAAILIGASTLAPDGIGGAIERLGWPKQETPGVVSEGATGALTEAARSSEIEGSADPSTPSLVSIASADGDITGIAVTAGTQATETSEIEADYAYRAPSGLGAESGYTSDAAYRQAEGDPAEAEESEPSETESSTPEDSTNEEASSSDEAPEEEAPPSDEQPAAEETTSPEPEETTSPEPEETTSPEPEETTSPEPEPSETSAPDETSAEPDPEPEETPSAEDPATDEPTEPDPAPSDDEKEKKDKKKDGPRGNSRSSNGFDAYEPEEQDPELDDPESSENESDATETEEDTESTQTETESAEAEEAESTEATASTEPRDTTPAWGSIH